MNLVYKYGLLAPFVGSDRVQQQMRAAHDYRNRLIELERTRRETLRAIDMAAGPELFEAVQQGERNLEAILDEIKRERGRTRKRSEGDALKQAAKEARAALKAAKTAWFEAVKASRPSAQAERDAANEAFLAARREARPGLSKDPNGVVAGTYQLVEDSVSQSAKAPLWDGGQPSDPRFLRWTGEGFVSQQIVGGATVDDVFAAHTQVRIGDQEWLKADNRKAGSRRSQLRKRVTLWLRVGSTEDRKPVWAKWPMVLHRPLPAGAQIQRATVRVRHIGPRAEWSVEFSLRCPDPAPKSGAAIAIDIGWRQRRDGTLRIACALDESGRAAEFVMPPEVASGISFPQGLRATRDLNMEAAKAELARWLGERDMTELGWLAEATDSLAQWRSQARLASLAIRWRDNRVPGDDEAFEALEAWRKQDRHLWLWETSQREGAMRARKDWYRRVAAQLAERYAVLVLEKFDLRTVARLAPVGQDQHENQTSRANRVVAALSEFRLVLRSAFTRRGGQVVEVSAVNTTRQCSVCGVVEDFDAAAMLRHKCANGHEWDQDHNAAANILERWRDAPAPEADRTPDAPTESRRERVARLRAEKVARMDRSKSQPEVAFGDGVG